MTEDPNPNDPMLRLPVPTFGERLRELREGSRMTVAQLPRRRLSVVSYLLVIMTYFTPIVSAMTLPNPSCMTIIRQIKVVRAMQPDIDAYVHEDKTRADAAIESQKNELDKATLASAQCNDADSLNLLYEETYLFFRRDLQLRESRQVSEEALNASFIDNPAMKQHLQTDRTIADTIEQVDANLEMENLNKMRLQHFRDSRKYASFLSSTQADAARLSIPFSLNQQVRDL